MSGKHKTQKAQELSQTDNADQVSVNKQGTRAITLPNDKQSDKILCSEKAKESSASYKLYHMDQQEWNSMSTDQKKLLLDSLTDLEKEDIKELQKTDVSSMTTMSLEDAQIKIFSSIFVGSSIRNAVKMTEKKAVTIAEDTVYKNIMEVIGFDLLNDSMPSLTKLFHCVIEQLTLPENIRRLSAAQAFGKEVKELQPYIAKELTKPEYHGRNFESILADYDSLEPARAANDPSTELGRVIAAARKMAEEPFKVTVKKTKNQKYPVDKYNRMFWNGIIDGNTKGGFDMKPPKGAIVMYKVNFDDLPDNVSFSKDITPFDKQVYTTAGSILWAGNEITTITQIYYQMGYRGKPAKKTLERIHESIEKMRFTHLWIDNDEETGKLKKRTHYHYDGYLLPAEVVTAKVNGKLTDEAIHFLKPDLPLMAFAAERGEITAITTELRQLPISMTEKNLALHDELYTRLSIEKNRRSKDQHCRMLLDTIYKNMGLTADQKVQRSRVKKNIIALLDHYKNNQFISKYVFEKDGITIYWK